MRLAEQFCKPVAAGTPPLSERDTGLLLTQVPEWTLAGRELAREFRFRDFRQAMEFVNEVAELANGQDHHPDILISYNKVRITLTTHKIKGLSVNDFIMAARTDLLVARQGAKAA